ncbi:hypothetical protein ACFUN8_29000 [Streptomyces sp. NPDC057307]|uniref:hypothetical protein n=1 Tax=Streptomyces sp. NPDC057307 TaxID=3346096 RepID=UPI0036311BF7
MSNLNKKAIAIAFSLILGIICGCVVAAIKASALEGVSVGAAAAGVFFFADLGVITLFLGGGGASSAGS